MKVATRSELPPLKEPLKHRGVIERYVNFDIKTPKLGDVSDPICSFVVRRHDSLMGEIRFQLDCYQGRRRLWWMYLRPHDFYFFHEFADALLAGAQST